VSGCGEVGSTKKSRYAWKVTRGVNNLPPQTGLWIESGFWVKQRCPSRLSSGGDGENNAVTNKKNTKYTDAINKKHKEVSIKVYKSRTNI